MKSPTPRCRRRIVKNHDTDFQGFKGFRLKWTSKIQNTPSFTSFNDAVQWAKSHVMYAVDQNEFDGKKTNVMKAFNTYFNK